eukprot:CAMPEP_0168383206 /NCGR_PEP_ID=MMETSP0228-20121227/13785_1 /TAXON_ID=133427 /ORGANISM="Protoceratium reticulatum, Strain CCCM 535 (=CCMP 1889)" /LENGTH=43 /DNA_ID= /DNA_START= /DNA_END= /DNA_ORIENTATION=
MRDMRMMTFAQQLRRAGREEYSRSRARVPAAGLLTNLRVAGEG